MSTDQQEKQPSYMTCRCGAQWTARGAAHCAAPGCHRTFAGVTLFDAHRTSSGERGTCRDPATITKAGERVMFHRNGMWRGPEDPDAATRWNKTPDLG
jgi:hypothetical protein